MPYPRTGQGGEPHLNLPDAITGNPGDQGAVRGLRCRPDRRYPYREPLPAPPPGGPPPGPARAVAARDRVHTGADTRAVLRAGTG